jgi:hypothetical protein
MRVLVVGAVAALCGCNQLLGLDTGHPAPSADDRDGDRVLDARDNCPDLPNPEQSDDDEDGIGDACDVCPTVTDPKQTKLGDADDIGDRCDAHAATPGDCLVVYDSFTDPAAFSAGWQVVSSGAPPTITTERGSVTIAPAPMTTVELLVAQPALDAYAGAVDLAAVATLDDAKTASRFGVVTHATLTTLAGCVIEQAPASEPQAGPTTDLAMHLSGLTQSSRPYGTLAQVRLVAERPDDTPTLECKTSFGVAFSARVAGGITSTVAAAGLVIEGDPVRVAGIAIYHYDSTASACPPPVLR